VVIFTSLRRPILSVLFLFLVIISPPCGRCNSFYCLSHFKNIYNDDERINSVNVKEAYDRSSLKLQLYANSKTLHRLLGPEYKPFPPTSYSFPLFNLQFFLCFSLSLFLASRLTICPVFFNFSLSPFNLPSRLFSSLAVFLLWKCCRFCSGE